MIPSPAPEHNFDEDIEVHGLDEFWHRKYGYDENHKVVRIATAEQVAQKGDAKNVHLPSPSYWPIMSRWACRSSATASSSTSGCALWAGCSPAAGSSGSLSNLPTIPDKPHDDHGHDRRRAGELAAAEEAIANG